MKKRGAKQVGTLRTLLANLEWNSLLLLRKVTLLIDERIHIFSADNFSMEILTASSVELIAKLSETPRESQLGPSSSEND